MNGERYPIKTIKDRIISLEYAVLEAEAPLRGDVNEEGNLVLTIDNATTEHRGVVKLYDGVDSDSTEMAATARAVMEAAESGGGGGGVPNTRKVATESPLTGGGTLKNDLSLAIDDASLTGKGAVQLSNDVTNDSDELAATISVVSSVAASIPDTDGLVPNTRTVITAEPLTGGGDLADDIDLGIAAATTDAVGAVQLYDDIDSDSDSLAATANAVKKVADSIPNVDDKVDTTREITTEAPLAGGGNLSSDLTLTVADGTTEDKGVLQLYDGVDSDSTEMAATARAVKEAFESSSGGDGVPTTRTIDTTSPVTGGGDLSDDLTIGIELGTTEAPGALQLYDGVDSDAVDVAATPNSVKTVAGLVDGKAVISVGEKHQNPNTGDAFFGLNTESVWLESAGAPKGSDKRTVKSVYCNGDIVILGQVDGYAVISEDGGINWRDLPQGLGNEWFGYKHINVLVGDGTVVMAGISEGYNAISRDGGLNWEALPEGLGLGSNNITKSIAITDTSIVVLFYSGNAAISKDKGYTWESLPKYLNSGGSSSGYLGSYQNTVVAFFDYLYASISTDGGSTWEELPRGLNTGDSLEDYTQATGVAVNASGIFIVSTYKGYASKSTDGGRTWEKLERGLNTGVPPESDSRMIVTCTSLDTFMACTNDGYGSVSETKGDSWDRLEKGLGNSGSSYGVSCAGGSTNTDRFIIEQGSRLMEYRTGTPSIDSQEVYVGNEWVPTPLPVDGTTDRKGIVQLYDDVDNDSDTLAATAGAVKKAYDAAIEGGGGDGDGVPITRLIGTKSPLTGGGTLDGDLDLGIGNATVNGRGAVRLYDGVDSDSDSLAATANAVKIAYDAAVSGGGGDAVPPTRTVTANAPLIGGGTLEDDIDIGIASASVDDAGVVQLYDGVDSDSNTLAATAGAVKKVYDSIGDGGGDSTPNPTFETITLGDPSGEYKAVFSFNEAGELIITYGEHVLKLITPDGNLESSGDVNAVDKE